MKRLAWWRMAGVACIGLMVAACNNGGSKGEEAKHFELTVTRVGTGAGAIVLDLPSAECATACSYDYAEDTAVTLTAVPGASSLFGAWGGACAAVRTPTCTVVMDGAKAVTARFDLITFPLSVSKTGTGTGSVTSNPLGINCGTICSARFAAQTPVTLAAVPAANSTFVEWSGACTGAGPCSVTLNEAKTVTATFAVVMHQLSVIKAGAGAGTVTSISPTGIDCGGTCSVPYTQGTVVTLTAVPIAGSVFTGWSGACSGIGSCAVTMSVAQTVTATFNLLSYSLTVARTGNGTGTITSVPAGITCGTDCSEAYTHGTIVTLTATPAANSNFVGWSGACTGTAACTVSMTAARNVTASFVLKTYSLMVAKVGTGAGTVTSVPAGITCGTDCSEVYVIGTTVTLSAVPAVSSDFIGWLGACSGTGSCVVTMSQVQQVSAIFTLKLFALNVAKSGNGAGTVTSAPTGIDCGTDCIEHYDYNTAVTLTAAPATGSTFTGWSGACTGTAACRVTMTAARSVTANFTLQTFTLTVKVRPGAGTVESMPTGISCWADCTEAYEYGTSVMLESTFVAPYFTFTGWSAPCSGLEPCSVTITGNTTITANYMPQVIVKLPGINFSPFLRGQDPNRGSIISEQQQRERMEPLVGYTDWLRNFGTALGQDKFCEIAKSMGFKVVASAWLGRNLTANAAEIASIITIANTCRPEVVVVGSEVLLRNDLTETQLLAYIEQVRAAIPPEIPITTADIYSVLWDHPAVLNAVDVVYANFYPYWEGVDISVAVKSMNAAYDHLVSVSNGKQVVVSETGWPSCGNQIGSAVPSLQNAAFYFKNVMSWAQAKSVTVFYFEGFDEAWKAVPEGPQGACWGLWTEDAVLKSGMHETFAGDLMANNWDYSYPLGGPGAPAIEFTFVPCYNTYENLVGRVLHVNPFEYRVAVYIAVNGRWWTKPTFAQPLTGIRYDGTFVTDVTTGGIDQVASTFAVYLVPVGYSPPLAGGALALPAELVANSVASIIFDRGTACPVVLP